MSDDESIVLVRWRGPWPDDDPDANFKHEVALYADTDALATVRALGANLDIPIGALVRYVLARWASEGSAGLLELGPSMTRRLNAVCEAAETEGSDGARLRAYEQLRQMLAWLLLPVQ